MDNPKKDFFVSYNQADKGWAEWIAWQLEDAGHTTSIQAWDFHAGGNFVLDMHRAAANARQTIAVLSKDYLAAPFTQAEWAAAFAQDPTGADRVLVPVRVGDCQPEGQLRTITYVELVELDEPTAKQALLTRIRGERLKPSHPPAFPGTTAGTATASPQPGSAARTWRATHSAARETRLSRTWQASDRANPPLLSAHARKLPPGASRRVVASALRARQAFHAADAARRSGAGGAGDTLAGAAEYFRRPARSACRPR